MLPAASKLTWQPAFRHQSMKRSRPLLSSSLRAERLQPPLGSAPILPISISVSQRRSRLTVSSLPMMCVLWRLANFSDSSELAPWRTEPVGGRAAQKDHAIPHDRNHFGDVFGASSELDEVVGVPDQLLIDHALGHRAEHKAHALRGRFRETHGLLQKTRYLQVPDVRVALPDRIEFRVIGCESEKAGQHSRIAREDGDHHSMVLVDPAVGIAEVGQFPGLLHELVEDRRTDLCDRRSQIPEVPVEEAVRKTGPGRDVLHTQTPETPLVQSLASCLLQQLPAPHCTRLQGPLRVDCRASCSAWRSTQTSRGHCLPTQPGRRSAANRYSLAPPWTPTKSDTRR